MVQMPRPKKYLDEEIEKDIRMFFQDPNHWVYQYGTPSECGPTSPYYKRQVEVLFEDQYFHWVTHRIINKLIRENFLKEIKMKLPSGVEIKFVVRSDVRYYKREIKRRIKLIEWYSSPKITGVLGKWGEHLAEFMFLRLKFNIVDRNTNKFKGKVWTQTNHDLDFIVEKDGIYYGVEVKNILPYMERDEFNIKLEMCRFLGLVPLWILRNAPKDQFDKIRKNGGFILKFKSQVYPIGFEDKVREIWNLMRLPVTVWERFPKKLEKLTLRFHDSLIKK